MNEKNRTVSKNHGAWIPEIDSLRAFAILSVIMIHVIYLMNFRDGQPFDNLLIAGLYLNVFSSIIAVPLFIFISGLVLCRSYYENFKAADFYKKRFKSIVPQYLIFSVLYMAFDHFLFAPVSFKEAILRILTANSYAHLWFFAMIIQLYLLYPLIIRLYGFFEKRKIVPMLIAASIAIDIFWTSLMLSYQSSITIGGFPVHIFFEMWLYFILGIHVGRNMEKYRSIAERTKWYIIAPASALLLLATGLLFLIPMKNHYNPVAPPYIPRICWYSAFAIAPFLCITTLPLFYKAALRIGKTPILSGFFASLGRHSFGIYLIHVFYLVVFSILLVRVGIGYDSWMMYPLMYALTLVPSYFTSWAISKVPYGEYLIGLGPSRQKKKISASGLE